MRSKAKVFSEVKYKYLIKVIGESDYHYYSVRKLNIGNRISFQRNNIRKKGFVIGVLGSSLRVSL